MPVSLPAVSISTLKQRRYLLNDLRSVVDGIDLWLADYRKTFRHDPSQKLDLVIDKLFDLFIANPALASVFVNEQHHLIKDKRGNVAKQYDDFLDLAEEIIREGVRKNIQCGY